MNTTFAENGSSGHFNINDFPLSIFALPTITLNLILSLPLNGYVLGLILGGPRGALASDFFSLNLAVSDIIYSVSTSFYLVSVTVTHLFFLFEVHMFSIGLLLTARPLFQCYICVECYVGVVHPVFFLRCKPLRYKVACCCVAWLMVLGSCIYSKYTYSNSLYLYAYFIQNVLLFFVNLFCCLSVARTLKHPGPGQKATERKKGNATKRRAFKIILIIMISMVINFFSYVVAIPLQCCLERMEFITALTICTSLALTAGFIQPLLYLHRNGKLVFFKL